MRARHFAGVIPPQLFDDEQPAPSYAARHLAAPAEEPGPVQTPRHYKATRALLPHDEVAERAARAYVELIFVELDAELMALRHAVQEPEPPYQDEGREAAEDLTAAGAKDDGPAALPVDEPPREAGGGVQPAEAPAGEAEFAVRATARAEELPTVSEDAESTVADVDDTYECDEVVLPEAMAGEAQAPESPEPPAVEAQASEPPADEEQTPADIPRNVDEPDAAGQEDAAPREVGEPCVAEHGASTPPEAVEEEPDGQPKGNEPLVPDVLCEIDVAGPAGQEAGASPELPEPRDAADEPSEVDEPHEGDDDKAGVCVPDEPGPTDQESAEPELAGLDELVDMPFWDLDEPFLEEGEVPEAGGAQEAYEPEETDGSLAATTPLGAAEPREDDGSEAATRGDSVDLPYDDLDEPFPAEEGEAPGAYGLQPAGQEVGPLDTTMPLKPAVQRAADEPGLTVPDEPFVPDEPAVPEEPVDMRFGDLDLPPQEEGDTSDGDDAAPAAPARHLVRTLPAIDGPATGEAAIPPRSEAGAPHAAAHPAAEEEAAPVAGASVPKLEEPVSEVPLEPVHPLDFNERLAEVSRVDRLEVSTDVNRSASTTGSRVVEVGPRRRFAFFAAIGAFVAEVLRLDDR